MSGLSSYLANELLDHVFGATARNYTSPSSIWVGLSSTDPTSAGSGITEIWSTGNGYGRVISTNSDWSIAAAGTLQNSTDTNFSSANSNWGIMSYFFMSDASSGGNMLGFGTLTTSKDITQGDTAKFTAGQLTISFISSSG